MASERMQMLAAIRTLGSAGAHFQFRQLREEMGVPSGEKNATARLHSAFKGLVDEKIIEEVPGDRKRNRFFRLVDERQIEQLLGDATPTAAPRRPGSEQGPDRLSRMEAQIAAIMERLDGIERRLGQLWQMLT